VTTIGQDRTVSPSCRPAVGENLLYAFKAPGKVAARTRPGNRRAFTRGLVLRRRRVINKRAPRSPAHQLWQTLSTRRGKQFNSMVHEQADGLTGAERDAVLMSQADAERLGLGNGEAVLLRSAHGEFRGRVYVAPVTPRNLQVHWPEAEGLIDRSRRSPQAGIPDYNAVVTVERLSAGQPAEV
jgi:anaerobic selenocysteine-containing dehydrogenase